MKFRILLSALFIVLIAPTAAGQYFTANLTPEEELAEVESAGSGTAVFMLGDAGLEFYVSVDGLTGPITNAHFHHAAAGVNGSPVRTILGDFDGNSASGVWTATDGEPLTDEMIAALFAGELYLNVHTDAYGPGEIRGQIFPSSGTVLTASLTPEQETGEVTSEGLGTASVVLTDAGALFNVTVEGLTGPITNAHFHFGPIGVSGNPVRTILDDFAGTTATGLWTATDTEPLTAEMIDALLLGNLYLNVHTDMFGPGEIRGQVVPSSGWGFQAALTPDQETQDVTSDGLGTGTFTLTEAGLVFRLTVEGLTGPITNAHFHMGEAGVSGGPVRTITDNFMGNTAMGVWTPDDTEPLTEEMITALREGALYVNVHTDAYAAGEIRGQVLPAEGATLSASLTSDQEPAEVDSDGTGTAVFVFGDAGLEFHVSVDGLTGPITNAHFHHAAAGVNGSPVRTIVGDFDGYTASGVWTAADGEPFSDEMLAALFAGELYLNVHTDAYGPGEIRGQIFPSSGTALTASLTPEQETGEVTSGGRGTASVVLTNAGALFNVTIDGLTGPITNAHFHGGPIGVSGSPVRTILGDFVGNTATGLWTTTDTEPLTEEMIDALLLGDLYLNVHTADFGPGEVRGQVIASSGTGAAVAMDPAQETHAVESAGRGTSSVTLTPAGVIFDVTIQGLTSELTNAHFHDGDVGANGGPVRTIFGDFDGNTAAGVWTPNDSEPLTEEMITELRTGGLYLNVHTTDYAPGELRGQINPNGPVITAVEQLDSDIPTAFSLGQNYPNPFNPETRINFSVVQSGRAVLTVYDAIGRRISTVMDQLVSPGNYEVVFNARALPSGVYLYELEMNGKREFQRMILLK